MVGYCHAFNLNSFICRCWGEGKAGKDHVIGLLHSTDRDQGNTGSGCFSGSYGPGVGQAQESTVVPPQAPEAAEESTTVEGNKVKSWMLYNSLINFCFM